MELNPSQIGIITELTLMTEFAKLGCTVFAPFGQNTKVDMIIEYRNKLYKIQSKHSTLHYRDGGIYDGKLDYAVFKTHWTTRSGSKVPYSKDEVDFFATVVNDQVYLIPWSETSGVEKRLRFLPPLNGQKNGITFAENYQVKEVLEKL